MNEDCERNIQDDEAMHSSTDSLSYPFQKELLHNKLLPYADELEAESQTLLAAIKANLGRAVMLREMQPGCSLWVTRLYKYIRIYGMKFSKEDHVLFVKLIYELVLIPDLEPFLVDKFATTLVILLKKKELISPEDLELPWRPLYELIHRLVIKGKTVPGMYRYACLAGPLVYLVHASKLYFPVSATQEILDELRPSLCPLDPMTMSTTLNTLGWFLPLKLSPKHHSIGHELWFSEFMNLWEVCHNAPQWEHRMMWIMARLAVENIGYINWEPYLPIMFTRFLRCLNLPVSYNKTQGSNRHIIETTPMAMWIASVLGGGSNAQMYLEKFLKTIETYFHPANYGQWLRKLKQLLDKLAHHFITRVHKERYAKPTWETPIPEKYKLTDDDIDAFVKCLMPVAMTAMFSKSCVNDAALELQYLATMRPSLVIPDVLERIQSTLDAVTESHKLPVMMICMIAIARPMVQGSRNINTGYAYPQGPAQVIPLLFSFLPGIDPNDMAKCFITFRLILIYATLMPIVDSSRSSAEMDEDERMIAEETSRFEDFVLQFLDRVFSLINSSSLEFVRLENRVGDGKSKLETVAETALSLVCTTLLVQTSDKIFQCALHKLRTFVTERILETKVAGQLAAVLCRSFARVNGKETLRALLPVLSQTIMDFVGEGEDIIKEENLDSGLLHPMLLLSMTVQTPGDNLLPHINTLTQVLDRVLMLKSREGNSLACNFLKSILLSLSTTSACQFRHVERDYNDADYPYVRDWGQATPIESLSIKWYIPGEKEIAVIKQIFFKYLSPELAKLNRYCEDCSTLTREELLTSLNIVRSIILGCESILPLWIEEPLPVLKTSLDWIPFSPTLGIKEEITMPDGGNVRQYMAGVMSNLQSVILKNAEDDTKSLFVLVQIWNSLLLGGIRCGGSHEARRKEFQITKRMLGNKLVGNKGHMGPFILERLDIQHETRVQSQSLILTETHKRIILELFQLGISRYADVRSRAQSSLFCAIENFPPAYTFIIPKMMDILKKDTEEHHDAYKGVLYTLHGPKANPLAVKGDWQTSRTLWPAIVLAKMSEKPSVIRLRETLVETVKQHFPMFTIKLEIPDTCITAASALWETYPLPSLPQPNKHEIRNGVKLLQETSRSNVEIYNGFTEDLLQIILKENLHWRHRLMAISFIRNLIYPDLLQSPKVVRYFLGALIHDSLQERKLAIRTVVMLLKQQKRKHSKVTIDLPVPPQKDESGNVIPGQRLDNAWLQYNYATRPLTAEEWDKPRYVHKQYVGYYAWPKKLQVYAPYAQQPCLDPNVRELTDHEKEVDLFFSDPQNIEKLVQFFSLEEKKEKDKFNSYRFLLFSGLFRNHGSVFLKHFLPHLRNLVTDKQESSQRCAAEIIAGIIKGAKHWPFQMTCDLWDSLLPIIRLALANLTVETVSDWGVCFATALQQRDPNRYHWILECLMEEPRLGESESSFLECSRLYTLQGALSQQLWRVSELLQRLLLRLEDRILTNPFENLRERLGSVLVAVFVVDLKFPKSLDDQMTPRARDFIDKIMPRLQILADESTSMLSKKELSLSAQVANVKFEDSAKDTKINTDEREAAIRLFKTMCNWIVEFMIRSNQGVLPEFYQLLPIVCQMENSDSDEELTRICSATLAILAQSFISPRDVPIALEAVTKISQNLSWWARSTSLEFLQVLVFHNMSTLLSNPEWIKSVSDIVLSLLEDDRLEVRETAGHVLSGLLHCTFIPDEESLLEEFKKKAKTKLHKKNSSNRDALRTRHAGVLGLCAFIQAHPYDMPIHRISIFEYLGAHMNDPQPIPTTIRKTLSDFKRTHYNGLTGINGHIEHFTEDQLAVLQDLMVPPSYYA